MLSTTVREQLVEGADAADRFLDWPSRSFAALRESGALSWSIPTQYGGTAKPAVELLQGMEEIASCCLTSAFILSQREAAIRQILKGPEEVKQRYLPRLAAGEIYSTVGLSQLTTSRQHLGPSLRATPLGSGGYQLNGEIPWVTGADQASAVVVGATRDDASQILVVIPADRLQGMIDPPLALASLVGSRTSLIRCEKIVIDADSIILGPTESVLGKVGGGGLETSSLAVGLAAAATDFLQRESAFRPELRTVAEKFEAATCSQRQRLRELAQTTSTPEQTLALRSDCTRLALRSTQACLMIAKGNGFVVPHPAQRWSHQAMFFLVWSCPRPVAEGVLADLIDWEKSA